MSNTPHNSGTGAGSKPKNIYSRGADDGLWCGLYVVVLFAFMVLSQSVPVAAIPATAMMFGMPFLTYFFLRRTHLAAHGMSVLSALWMQGITMFACASLIFGAVAFCYLRWVNPSFLLGVLRQVAEMYEQAPAESARALAAECRMIISAGTLPPPSGVVMSFMWMVMFSGSLLSLFCALVIRLRARISGKFRR